MSWNSIINQHRVKEILTASIQRKRLAHAYLFSGPEGVGKYAAGIELAKIVNCHGGRPEACDHCPSCLNFETLQHPNVSLIFPLPVGKNEKQGDTPLAKLTDDDIVLLQKQISLKAKNPYHRIEIPRATGIKVNSIREIRKESSFSTFTRGMKVFLILDADTMNDEAANALLKTLEEPHGDTLLILTTTRTDMLLPTIMSRCQHIRFDPLTNEVIEDALRGRESLDPEQARSISQLARGSYTRALLYLHSSLGDQRKEAVELLRSMLFKSRQDLLDEIDRVTTEYEKFQIEELLQLLQYWLRDAMMLSEGIQKEATAEDVESLRKFIQRYPSAFYDKAIEAVDNAISLLYKNVYIPLILVHLALTIKSNVDPTMANNRPAVAVIERNGS